MSHFCSRFFSLKPDRASERHSSKSIEKERLPRRSELIKDLFSLEIVDEVIDHLN